MIEDREREEAGHRATPSRKKRERADSPTSNPNSTYPRLNKKKIEKKQYIQKLFETVKSPPNPYYPPKSGENVKIWKKMLQKLLTRVAPKNQKLRKNRDFTKKKKR